jgi:hypothetical protein
MLVIIYHLLQQQKSYEELGGNYFEERDRQATEKRLVRRLEKFGLSGRLGACSSSGLRSRSRHYFFRRVS